MASLLTPRQAMGRPKATANGGLGGFVQTHIVELSSDISQTGTWPKCRKRRPPPLKILYGSDELLVPAPQRSALWQDSKSPWSPRTPTSYGSDTAKLVGMGNSSTPLSRFNYSAVTPSSTPSRSFTPTKLPPEPVELPGSLLLPSQGLEPPPFTPPRHHNLTRRDTDESDFGSVPSLTSSTSSCFSEMDRLRGWKPTVSSGATPTASTSVSKPFPTMSFEELLEALPKCNTSAITQMWVPAMKEKYDALMTLVRNSTEHKDDSTMQLTSIGKDLMTFAQEARAISNTYSNTLKSAESLVERDTAHFEKGLRTNELKLREEKAKAETLKKTIKDKEDAVNRLDSTLRDVVGVLGNFIKKHIPQWVDSFQEPSTQAVMQVIADYNNIITETSTRYVRIPETTHSKILASLQDAQANVQKYRAIASSQAILIKEQDILVESHALKYEQCLRSMKEKNDEILVLVEKRTELEKKVEEYETALSRSELTVRKQERLQKRNAELEKLVAATVKAADERDAQIAGLRSQLGSAREEVIARRADVRNVIVQSQAMLAMTEPSETSSQSSGSKTRKILGRPKDKSKPRQPLFPHSQSGLNLSFGRPLNPDLMSSPPDPKYSSKEVVSKHKKSTDLISSTPSITSSSTYSQDSKNTTRLTDPFHDIRPRADSLGALEATRQIVRSHPANIQKQLPTPPPTVMSTTPPNHAPPAPSHGDTSLSNGQNYRDVQVYPDYSPQQTARRILSDIPEASVEDTASPRPLSATSSDREVYRRSIHLLNALSGLEDSPRPREPVVRVETSEVIERVESQSSEGSEPQTVSEMYHDGRKWHLRS